MVDRPETELPALRPTPGVARIRRVATRFWLFVGLADVLTVADRRTGARQEVPLIAVTLDGHRYVLAFGGVTEWARNLRAAGRGELRHRGRTQAVAASEVDGDERDRVIAKYFSVRGSGPVRRDFDRRPDATDHPTFRLDPTT
jgi:deazaflavin-dependent oxidoreductase (nitroreductase family)